MMGCLSTIHMTHDMSPSAIGHSSRLGTLDTGSFIPATKLILTAITPAAAAPGLPSVCSSAYSSSPCVQCDGGATCRQNSLWVAVAVGIITARTKQLLLYHPPDVHQFIGGTTSRWRTWSLGALCRALHRQLSDQ